MNSCPDDLNPAERAALRRLREQVRRQHHSGKEERARRMTTDLISASKHALRSPGLFIRYTSATRLRRYQQGVCEAICDSVLNRRGLTFVVMFPRQSGKNELQAQLETYLLALFCDTPAEIVKVSPTLKPQSLNAMRRLERTLKKNLYLSQVWHKEAGTLYRVAEARIHFLSGADESNIVGATANLLLEVDEAQDIAIAKFDKDIAPMAASSNATRVFWGTAWTGQTLLARESRAASQAQAADGLRRVFWQVDRFLTCFNRLANPWKSRRPTH